MTDRSVESILQELGDRAAIAELTARYNQAADDGDGEAFASVFTEHGVFEISGPGEPVRHEGRAALVAVSHREPRQQVHLTADPIVELDGDRARQSCTLLYTKRPASSEQEPQRMLGRYEDDLVRTSAGWRFARRTVSVWF